MANVVVVAVHPDDETLGCGGTLLKHKANGDNITWIICTKISEELGFSASNIEKRKSEIELVKEMYRFDQVHNLSFNTTQLDIYPSGEIISEIANVFNKVQPNIIYLPFKSDVHSDHRNIFEATYSCTKSFRYSFIKKIYMMETLSETEFAPSTKEDSFIPNVFVNITDFFAQKLDIISIYESELGTHPFPRSLETIEALAKYRGAMAGCKYAESFMLLKEIC